MRDYSRKCVVCGAAVNNMNPKCNTCDPICTRAKHNKISRAEQVMLDIKNEEREEKEKWK